MSLFATSSVSENSAIGDSLKSTDTTNPHNLTLENGNYSADLTGWDLFCKFGWLDGDGTLSTNELIGCALVFSAVILSQIPIKTKKVSL